MAATQAQLRAVLDAAAYLLGARQDDMDTVTEWAALARAVGACTGKKTAEYLAAQPPAIAWDEAVDGALPKDGD